MAPQFEEGDPMVLEEDDDCDLPAINNNGSTVPGSSSNGTLPLPVSSPWQMQPQSVILKSSNPLTAEPEQDNSLFAGEEEEMVQ